MVEKKSATQYCFSGLNLRHCNSSPTPMLTQKSACIYMGLYFLDPGLFQCARREVSTMLTFTVSIKINVLVTSQRGTGQHPPQESAVAWWQMPWVPPVSLGAKWSVHTGRNSNAHPICNQSIFIVSLQARLPTMTNQERPKAVDKGQLLVKTTLTTISFLLLEPPGCGARGTIRFSSALSANCSDKKHQVQQELRAPWERKPSCECTNKRKISLSSQTHGKTHCTETDNHPTSTYIQKVPELHV